LKRLATNLLKEVSVGRVEQRVQLNTEKSLSDLERQSQNSPTLIYELEPDGTVKAYENKEYEIYHNLGKECKTIAIADCEDLVQIFRITELNPNNMDRNKFVRIRVVPMTTSGSTVIVDTLGLRRLKFWVN